MLIRSPGVVAEGAKVASPVADGVEAGALEKMRAF
jgi:hypothetical protein